MLPVLSRRAFFPLQEWIKGKSTLVRLRELEETQWWSQAALRERQWRALHGLLEFAYREVPYYSRLLDEHRLQPWRVQSFEDFARIPHLTRDLVRRHHDELQPRRTLRGVQRMSTGGSTGAPVTIMVDRDRAAFTDATRLRAHRWFGVDVGSPEIVLWGSPIETGKQDIVRNLRDRLLNSKLLSAFDLSEAALARHAQVLLRFRPRKLFGYASALYLLACYIERQPGARRPTGLRVAFTTAEPLYDFQRATIQSVYGCPAAVEYGCRDAGLIANECPAGGLHVASEGITVETLPEDGSGVDGRGEIVVTNAYSFAMPMIRYRTGDIGSLATGSCGCGRNLPRLGAVEGRQTDFLVTPEGRVMHALAAIYVLRELPGLREFQVVQERADLVQVSLVTEPGFTRETSGRAGGALERLLGHGVTVDVQVVNDIPPAASGKHRYVISKVANQQIKPLLGRR
jgi:phenylacetate-coenzyme A ligase PaaK-like adenylate-forming protein